MSLISHKFSQGVYYQVTSGQEAIKTVIGPTPQQRRKDVGLNNYHFDSWN
jgi:hypothetical protein